METQPLCKEDESGKQRDPNFRTKFTNESLERITSLRFVQAPSTNLLICFFDISDPHDFKNNAKPNSAKQKPANVSEFMPASNTCQQDFLCQWPMNMFSVIN